MYKVLSGLSVIRVGSSIIRPVSQQSGQQYLLSFELWGESPVERTGQPAAVQLSGVEQHVPALLVDS